MHDNWYPMRWFGDSWGSLLNILNPKVDAPVGRPCNSCGLPIEAGDTGALTGAPATEGVWHWDCFVAETKKPPAQ